MGATRKRLPPITLLVVLALLNLAATPQPQRRVTYERYDVDIDVHADGCLLVAESRQLRFEGEFRTGDAATPLKHVADITGVGVCEGTQPTLSADLDQARSS